MQKNIPIHLQSKAGIEYAGIIGKEYFEAKDQDTLALFKDMCHNEASRVHKALNLFLGDKTLSRKYKLDEADKEGWAIYKSLMDKYEVLKFYGKQP